MMKYNKSKIMSYAWMIFDEGWYDTFSKCLKESWEREKEIVDRINKERAEAKNSEQVKAWNWACKKLGVEFDDMEDYQKMNAVLDEAKYSWRSNVWSEAMRAVKLHIENEKIA